MDEREEAYYFHTLMDLSDMIEDHGAKKVLKDFKASAPVAYEEFKHAIVADYEDGKRAALFHYASVMNKDYDG